MPELIQGFERQRKLLELKIRQLKHNMRYNIYITAVRGQCKLKKTNGGKMQRRVESKQKGGI